MPLDAIRKKIKRYNILKLQRVQCSTNCAKRLPEKILESVPVAPRENHLHPSFTNQTKQLTPTPKKKNNTRYPTTGPCGAPQSSHTPPSRAIWRRRVSPVHRVAWCVKRCSVRSVSAAAGPAAPPERVASSGTPVVKSSESGEDTRKRFHH